MQEDSHSSQPIREGEAVLKRLEQMREAVAGLQTSGTVSRWEQYLPGLDASLSREDPKLDNYRLSLQKRLDRLFREERQLIKERHYSNQLPSQQKTTPESLRGNPQQTSTTSTLEDMERKLKALEDKYRLQPTNKPAPNASNKPLPKATKKEVISSEAEEPTRQKSTIFIESSQTGKWQESQENKEKLTEWGKCQSLEAQVLSLKEGLAELRVKNEQLATKIMEREERKKHKRRSKELLLAIADKLELISSALSVGGKGKEKRESLKEQFARLKDQYSLMEGERRRLEEGQREVARQMQQLRTL